jgi:hypothetical protein
MRFLVGRWIGKAIYVAAELGIADILAQGPRSIDALARKTNTHAGSLYRVMRALAGVGIFEEMEGARFTLTPMAECLRTGAMRPIARLFWSEFEDRAWMHLLEGIRQGKTPFELAYSTGVGGRCEVVACDFFKAAPQGGDAYLLSNVLHDWPDEACIRILRNCRDAMHADSRLLVAEMVIQRGNAPSVAKLLDLEMLVVTGGRERTEEEYRVLLESSGLFFVRTKEAGHGVSIMEAAPKAPPG